MGKTKGGTGGEDVAGRSNCRAYREGAMAFIVSKGGRCNCKGDRDYKERSIIYIYIFLFNFPLT